MLVSLSSPHVGGFLGLTSELYLTPLSLSSYPMLTNPLLTTLPPSSMWFGLVGVEVSWFDLNLSCRRRGIPACFPSLRVTYQRMPPGACRAAGLAVTESTLLTRSTTIDYIPTYPAIALTSAVSAAYPYTPPTPQHSPMTTPTRHTHTHTHTFLSLTRTRTVCVCV